MKCLSCGFENPGGFAFCGKCGTKLALVCPQCGTESPPELVFCGKCGSRLVPGATSAPIAEHDLARLKPYLPPRQFDDLPPAPLWEEEDSVRAQECLGRLLDAVITYLPRHLVAVELAPSGAPPTGGAFLDGALLFADISGFTALSERLGALGKEGAEQITDLVNRYFGAMLEVLFAHGGDLFKFGGDALLAFFADGAGGGPSALQAAWAMQEAMAAFHQVETSLGTFPLQMKIGLHAGPIFAARVGTAREREFFVTGPTVNATSKAEGLASAGEILFSPTVHDQVRGCDWLSAVGGPAGHYLVERIHPGAPALPHPLPPPTAADLRQPGDEPEETLRRTLDGLDRLTAYLPTGLLPRLVPDPTRQETSGEHRLVAVLFANFVGASDLVTRLGRDRADEIAQALDDYFVTMQEAVSRYGGVVNKVDLTDHGDKLLVLFGAPVAHEDDAERAVRAALEMQAAVPSPTEANEGRVPWLEGQRVGVCTGMVFAGHVGAADRHEYTVMGDEVNLAARLMSAAVEGEILVTNYVQRKVGTVFEVADRGEVSLRGKSRPVLTYAIVGYRARPAPVRGIRGLRSPLVGRDAEEATLRRLVADLRLGRGAIVLLIGEAGVGKSRLVAELLAQVGAVSSPSSAGGTEGELTWLQGRGLAYTQQTSYSAFIDVIHAALDVVETDSEFDRSVKLHRRVGELLPGEAGEDVMPYLAHLLGLTLSGAEAERVAYLEGEALQRQILRAVVLLLEQMAREGPLILTFDDLHWADSASLALLERCLSLADRVPILILLAYRPDRHHGCWALGQTAARDYPHCYTEILLAPLDREAGQDIELACNLLSLQRLPPALAHLVGRAEGNPFYVEEIIRTLIDQGAIVPQDGGWQMVQEVDPRTVPDTLQRVIMARMDRLSEGARRTLQLAAVIGRTFHYNTLAWLASAAALAAQLDANLSALQRAELVRERSRWPELEYIFKHVMIRDVAYESLLVRDRCRYHRLVGQHLETVYVGRRQEEVYELLAHHYSLSDDPEQGLVYLIKAGDKARVAYANPEAIGFYQQAESLAQELDRPGDLAVIAEGLGDVLFHVGEYDEALACFERALGHRTEARQRADLHRRIGMVHEKRGEYEEALAACARGIELLSPEGEDTVEMARLLTLRCRVYKNQGQFKTALVDGEQGLALIRSTTYYQVIAQAHKELGSAYYRYGQPADAVAHFEHALAIAERTGDEHSVAAIYNNLAIIYYQTDLVRSTDYFGRYLETMQRLGDVWGESTALQNLGIIHYARGNYAEAIDYYQRSLRMWEQLGESLGLAQCHINLGEAYRALSDPAQAIVHLEKGLVIAQEIGASDDEAECHRQLAECYLEIDEPERALATCQQALDYAQRIGGRKEEGIIRRVLGNTYLQLHDPNSATTHLEQSVAVLRELNRELDLGTALYDYARALTESGQMDLAREQYLEALALFERLKLPQEQARVRAALDRLS